MAVVKEIQAVVHWSQTPPVHTPTWPWAKFNSQAVCDVIHVINVPSMCRLDLKGNFDFHPALYHTMWADMQMNNVKRLSSCLHPEPPAQLISSHHEEKRAIWWTCSNCWLYFCTLDTHLHRHKCIEAQLRERARFNILLYTIMFHRPVFFGIMQIHNSTKYI